MNQQTLCNARVSILKRAAAVSSISLLCIAAHAANTCMELEPGAEQSDETPAGATAVGLIKLGAKTEVILPSLGGVVTPKGNWTAPKLAIGKVEAAVKNKSQREKYRLAFMQDGKPMEKSGYQAFFLKPVEEASKAIACSEASASVADLPKTNSPGLPASAELCARFAQAAPKRNQSWILFDSTGAACHIPFPARQYDTLRVGMVVNKGEVPPQRVVATVTGCTTPTPGVRVYSGGEFPKLQSGDDVNVKGAAVPQKALDEPMVIQAVGSPVSCSSDTVTAAVSVGGQAGQGQAVALYPRHTATFHLGAVYSKLREPDYGLRSVGTGNVITDREPSGRGPHYVTAVVVQAIPRYFMSGGGLGYPGRDLLHDHELPDRVGLVLAFGLKDPTKRFGLGVSYEIANGINVMVLREWSKQTALDGVALGDTFAGDATTIPKRQTWARGTSLGLSLDLGYVGKIFGTK